MSWALPPLNKPMLQSIKKILINISLLVLIAGCDVSFENSHEIDQDSAIAAIQQQAQRFSQAYMDGDIDALVAVYSDDGIAASSGRDFVAGHTALNQFWVLPSGRSILQHQSTSISLQVNGQYAYDWGYYSGQAAQDGNPLPPFRGKYVIIWQLDDDGQWRMLMDMWNSMPAETPAGDP